jgi:hypothetical protein
VVRVGQLPWTRGPVIGASQVSDKAVLDSITLLRNPNRSRDSKEFVPAEHP